MPPTSCDASSHHNEQHEIAHDVSFSTGYALFMMCCQPPLCARVRASNNGSKGSHLAGTAPKFSGPFLRESAVKIGQCYISCFSQVATIWLSQQRARNVPILRAHPKE